ncbi:hypothetical protein BH20ACT2_BH20ACT2_01790 [soil metagenome]
MSAPYEITAVEHLGGHRLRLTFADGFIGDVDLSDRFGEPVGPIFRPLQDIGYFAQVVVDAELGTVVWPNGADLAPEVLHEQALSLA